SYLVTYLNAGYMAYALRKDEAEKNKVDAWLATITADLRYLFEDDSLELEYKEKEKVFYINQEGKEPFTFSQLSSGYSSILKVYADLLMKVELRGIEAKELSGIVIIDEVDAHLHVSLQKKILSFLDNAYPNIQFIVSTHSSFVIQSVDNAVIYDLSKLEQLENLSMYSSEAITKGLLGVKTTSNALDDIVTELSRLTPKIESNEARVKELIELLSTNESELDARSKVILLVAKQAILDRDVEGE
ncbi:MAG: putative ATP-binding protein involved in virulence, partial [Phenylobacterium sp.]